METDKVAVVGVYIVTQIFSQGSKEIKAYLLNKTNIYGRILFILRDYLIKYSKKFDRVRFRITNEVNNVFPNGTITGIIGMVNRSEIDVGIQPIIMSEVNTEKVDFTYPYKISSFTFVTRKAEYKPQIFGILQTFSLPLWIAIVSILIVISLLYYIILKRRYSFDKILLHTFAVLLRQSSILKPSSMIENVLVFSWVAGAMFLCLAYDSVFLSFLAFPPVNQVKDVPQLAKAVQEERYHCITSPRSAIFGLLRQSTEENLRIIGQDLVTNNLTNGNAFQDFLHDRSKQNLVYLLDTNVVDIFTVGKKFVSEDRFLETIGAVPVRKDFCCKKLLEEFTHKFMASGLYFKYQNDRAFLMRMPLLLQYEEKDTSKRKLSLTDVAPAFIFLIFGHAVSFLVLIVEMLSSRTKKVACMKKKAKQKNANRMQRRFCAIIFEN